MAQNIQFTQEEQLILDHAKHETEYKYDEAMSTRFKTSAKDNDCFIHATLGTEQYNQYFLPNHQAIRRFLFAIVNSFTDADLHKKDDGKQPLRDLMNEIGLVGDTFAKYRDTLCQPKDMDRFLNTAEMRLMAILTNAYVLNWTNRDNKISVHKGHVFAPDPALRDLIMAHVVENGIAVPDVITACDTKPIRAMHVENSSDIHFSRVEWKVDEKVLFPQLDKAINLYNAKLTNSSPKVEEQPKVESRKTNDKPKTIPNPAKGHELVFEGKVPVTATAIVWSDDEKKKIYRNNINYLLHMMAQKETDKNNFMAQLLTTPLNGSLVYRDAAKAFLFYTKLDHTKPADVAALLIENIQAYENLKIQKSPSGRLLKQYQELKAAVQTATSGDAVLDNPKTETFTKHAYVRTRDKGEYLLNKVVGKLDPDENAGPIGMLHRKASASEHKGTQYHMVGLGNLKAAAQWINDDMPKEQHILKQGSHKYRLYLSQDSAHHDRYQIFKCAVDETGEYKPDAKPQAITRAEEALWEQQIEGVFKGYGEYKQTILYTGGFKPTLPKPQ